LKIIYFILLVNLTNVNLENLTWPVIPDDFENSEKEVVKGRIFWRTGSGGQWVNPLVR
jgi:hypothetical protein